VRGHTGRLLLAAGDGYDEFANQWLCHPLLAKPVDAEVLRCHARRMKLKRLVEDFQVEEQISLQAEGGGFALYRLTKQSLGTLEAIGAVLRRWNVPRQRAAFAGLKDKHAQTTQYVTIRGGPRRDLRQSNLELLYMGQAARPIHASDITANRFSVVIRDLGAEEAAAAIGAIASVAADGLPNYFDNQRFGSLGESGEFIGKPWCLGDYERAVWLAMAEPNVHDRPVDREEKGILREHWGDWPNCHGLTDGSARQRIVAHLLHLPTDFRRAIAILPQELRSLCLAAFQSHLWNQILAALIRQVCRPEQCITRSIGRRDVPLFVVLDAAQREQLGSAMLPLPSARLHLEENPLKPLYEQALVSEGMELRQVRVKYPRDSFFSKGERSALVRPSDFRHELAMDELYEGRQKLSLWFLLPRGSYATLLVKRIVGAAGDELAAED
jgi:tRNA pseudouridine13 synthase